MRLVHQYQEAGCGLPDVLKHVTEGRAGGLLLGIGEHGYEVVMLAAAVVGEVALQAGT